MCGICGFLIGERESKTGSGSSGTATRDELTSQVRAMASTLRHRGPDDAGEWVDAASGVALGHRRLSILDLSPEGAQPMLSACGRYAIVFNGEIYNFRELRAELEQQGASFRGSSDTEVLVEAMSLWGVEETLVRALGMFALALWDLEARKLTLARDRVGKKPLYYGWNHGRFYFASELKALHAHPEFRPELSRDTLALFVAYSYVPSPYSIYDGLHKLPPGSLLVMDSEADASTARPRAYWSAASEMERAAREPSNLEPEAAVDALDELLRDAVGRRMIADVELGALLSGGIDSSLVVSVMQALSSRPVKTFSIGFQEAAHDESEYAAEIARHLGTDHTTRIVTAQDALALVPKLPELYDEPFADTSQIPTYLVSALAREKVTVALSGDGGDELFAGYNRYFTAVERWRRTGWIPRPLRSFAAQLLRPASGMSGAIAKEVELLPAVDTLDVFARRRARHRDVSELVLGARPLPTLLNDRSRWPQIADPLLLMSYIDFAGDLAEDILAKVDRASMGVSLEVRCPLLDHRVAEFAWRLPMYLKVQNGERKWLMRRVLERHVPRALTDRPKQGFGMPVGDWLRGPLHGWAEEMLDEGRLKREGWLAPAPIRRIWREHEAGRRDRTFLLWNLLMFQAWIDAQCRT